MNRQICLIAALVCVASAARAQTAGAENPAPGTNFPQLQDYPGPSCAKPGEQPKRPSTINNMEVDRYNALLAKYNKVVRDYVVCVNKYVRNADGDMDIIRKKSRDAVDEANR